MIPTPERLEDLRVAMVGYRDRDGGERTTRVDIIDVRAAVSLLSLPPAEALRLANQLREVAGWTALGTEPGS